MSMLSKALGGGGSKIPGYNTGKLNDIASQTAEKQRQLIQQRFSGLQPINQQFETSRNQLSASVAPQAENAIKGYGEALQGVNTADAAARQQATDAFRQQAFRNVPEIQRQIRNSLGGNRLLGSGAAVSTLANPTVNAAQTASDFAAQNESARLAGQTGRAQDFATTGFNTRQQALATRLGLDEGTINQLASMGRSDLIDKFNSLAGVEGDLGQNQLSIEQLGQSQDIARAQAEAAKKGAILSSLGSLAGLGVGSFFGPMGAAVGSQIGGTVGGVAAGNAPQQFDPTLLFALGQNNPANKRTAVVRSLGGNRQMPVGTGAY